MDIGNNIIELIENPINLFRNQNSCDDKCSLIIEDVLDYLKTSKEEDDFK